MKLRTLLAAPLLITTSVSQGQVLEEIIVTAQKRQQNLQDVGISVTAFTGETIDRLGYTNTTDIAQQTPSLNFVSFHPVTTNISIRGISQNEFGDHLEPPVAVYVDDAYLSVLGAAHIQMYDVERVEVLRGPQGTLFGRNATGGLMHFISRKPTDQFSGFGQVTIAEYDQIKTEGAISGPLTDNLLARLSFQTNDHDGWLENRTGPDLRDSDSEAIRGQLLFQATENLDFWLKGHYAKNDQGGNSYTHNASQLNGNLLGEYVGRDELGTYTDIFGLGVTFQTCPGCDGFGYVEPDDDPHTGSFDTEGKFKREISGATGKITWSLDDFTITSVTDYVHIDKDYSEDTDGSPFDQLAFHSGQDLDQFSQEIRLNGDTEKMRWLAGLYYLDIKNDTFQNFVENGGGFFGLVDDMGNPIIDSPLGVFDGKLHLDLDTESWAVFGHMEYDFSEHWTGIAALRYTEDDKEASILNTDNFGTYSLLDPSNTPSTKGNWENISSHVELDWKPNADWLVYASWRRGHKAGSMAAGSFAPPDPDTLQHDEEVLNSYEIGFKATLLDGRARLNADVFYYDYEDYQAAFLIVFTQTIGNLDAEVYGGEIELEVAPIEGLIASLGVSFLDSTVEDVGMPDGTTQDRQLVAAPDYSLNGMVRYEWPAFTGSLSIQGDFNYVDEFCFTVICHPTEEDDGYFVGNLRAGYSTSDGSWQVYAFVNNVTDEEYRQFSVDGSFVGFTSEAFASPRWYGGTIRYQW